MTTPKFCARIALPNLKKFGPSRSRRSEGGRSPRNAGRFCEKLVQWVEVPTGLLERAAERGARYLGVG